MKSRTNANGNGDSTRSSVGQSIGFLKGRAASTTAAIAQNPASASHNHPEQTPEAGGRVVQLQPFDWLPKSDHRKNVAVLRGMGIRVRRYEQRYYVYFLLSAGGIAYIGQTCRLAERIRFHSKAFAGRFDDVLFLRVSDARRAAELERSLIEEYSPPLNRACNSDWRFKQGTERARRYIARRSPSVGAASSPPEGRTL